MDPYWSDAVAVIPFTGVGGDVSFTDLSDTPHTITRAGDAQITRDNIRNGRTSLILDGTGDYLNLGDSADFDFGAGDFCIEFWAYVGATEWAGAGMFAANWDGSSSNQSWKIEYSPALNAVYFWYSTTGSDTGTANFDFDTDGDAGGPTDFFDRNWHHIAIVRTGSTICVHFDGRPGAGIDATNPTLFTNSGIDTLIGAERSGGGVVNVAKSCQLQDFRITKGNSRYRAGVRFNPPKRLELGVNTVDEFFDDVAALLKFEGADGSTSFSDLGPLALTCTSRNSAAIDTAFSKFGSSSLLIDASTQAVAVGGNITGTALDIETRDFCVECWIRAGAEPADNVIWSFGSDVTPAPDEHGLALVWASTNVLRLRTSSDGSTFTDYDYDPAVDGDAIGVAGLWDGNWHHIAVVRNGGVLMTFLDGAGKSFGAVATDFWTAASRPMTIGGAPNATGALSGANDLWVDDFRATVGVGRYHADFTPPTATHPVLGRATPTTDTLWDNVELLLTGDTPRGSTAFTDSSVNGFTVTNVGTWAAEMDNHLHGVGALAFNGARALSIPDSAELTFGSGNFTIEFWMFCPDTEPASTFTIMSKYDLLGAQEWWIRYSPSLNQFYFQYSTNGTSTTTITHDTSLSLGVDDVFNGEWHHFAITREGTAIHFHIDGDESSGGTDPGANAIADTARPVVVGARYSGATPGEYAPTGILLDGIRITRGQARYTSADFTPDPLPWGLEGPAPAGSDQGAISTVIIMG